MTASQLRARNATGVLCIRDVTHQHVSPAAPLLIPPQSSLSLLTDITLIDD